MSNLIAIRTWRYKGVLGQDPLIGLITAFTTLIVLSHVTSELYFPLLNRPVSFREVIYPLTFLISTLTVELYGASSARRLVTHGAIIYLLLSAFLWLANQLPVAPSSPLPATVFNQAFGHPWSITTSKLVVYLTAHYTHIYLWHSLKEQLKGGYWWAMGLLILSSSCLLDTLLISAARSWLGSRPLVIGDALLPYALKELMALGGLPIIALMRRAHTKSAGVAAVSYPRPLSAWDPSFLLLCCIFLSTLLLTNVITAKYFKLGGGLILTSGAITYPFTFSLLDIISELYGSSKARVTVGVGLAGSLLMTAILQMASQLPSYEGVGIGQSAFQLVFGFTPGIVIGSMVAYLAAQLLDIYLFDWARGLTGPRHLWFRNNISTLISQLVDTVLFGLIAWVLWPMLTWNSSIGALPWSSWYPIIINEYAFKIVFTIINTPLVYWGVYAVRRLSHPTHK